MIYTFNNDLSNLQHLVAKQHLIPTQETSSLKFLKSVKCVTFVSNWE